VGATLPLMTLVFGSSTASFNTQATSQANPQSFTSQINHLVLYFVYLFIGRFVVGYVATLSICIAATRTTRALRKAFLESLLRQEIQHFDGEGNGSPATQVTTSTTILFTMVPPIADQTYRWQPCQSRHCRETVHSCPRSLTPHLFVCRGLVCPMEACSHSHDYHACNICHLRRGHFIRYTHRISHRKCTDTR